MSVLFPAGRNVSVKEVVIRILSEEWPLSVKQIYERAKRMHAVECTYQAVFKHVKELSDKGILEREGHYYTINVEWLRRLYFFAQSHIEFYKDNPNGIIGPVRDFKARNSAYQKTSSRVVFEI